MSTFTDAYVGLLIKQYYEKGNARGEIALQAAGWEKLHALFVAYGDEFDLDLAVGAQLDIVGKWVGAPRSIPFPIDKVAFGFSSNPKAKSFARRVVDLNTAAATPPGVTVDGAGQTGGSIDLKGFIPSLNNVLLAGEELSIGGAPVAVQAAVNSDGTGTVTVSVLPVIGTATIDDAPVGRINVTGQASAPFARKTDPTHTPLALADFEYRRFIRMKIGRNFALPFMATDAGLSIQDAVFEAFDGLAFVVDKKNMTFDLYVDMTFDIATVLAAIELDFLPRPQGVGYTEVSVISLGNTFGFSSNGNSKGFSSKFDPAYIGGVFARKVI